MLGVIGERKPVDQSRTLDAGYFSNPLQHLPAENFDSRLDHIKPGLILTSGVHVLLPGQPHFRCQQMVRIKTRARMQDASHRIDHQPRANQRDQRHRDLSHHQDVACAMTRLGGRAPASLSQTFTWVVFRGPIGGDQPEHQAGQHADTKRKEQHPAIHRDSCHRKQICGHCP